MNNIDRQAHWQNVYATKAEKEVSWFQKNPAPSLDLIAAAGISTDAAIIDVGGGASAADLMESERKPGDIALVERSNAAGLTIRYLLPRVLPMGRGGH